MSCTVVFYSNLQVWYVLSLQNTRRGSKCPIGLSAMHQPLTNENSLSLLSHLFALPFFPFAPGKTRHRNTNRMGHTQLLAPHTQLGHALSTTGLGNLIKRLQLNRSHPIPKKSIDLQFPWENHPITFSKTYTRSDRETKPATYHLIQNSSQELSLSPSPVFGQHKHPQTNNQLETRTSVSSPAPKQFSD